MIKRTVIIAPSCVVPRQGAPAPEPNEVILKRALELAAEVAQTGSFVTILTDDYMRQPTKRLHMTTFLSTGPLGLRSTVAFLNQVRLYLGSSPGVTVKCVVTPHYKRRFVRDYQNIIEKKPDLDPFLLFHDERDFFSPEGANLRSRHYWVWRLREVVLNTISLLSWEAYALLSK